MDILTNITVKDGWLTAGEHRYPCTIGRKGVTADKREGDLATPIGSFPLRMCYFRPDRVRKPQTALPTAALQENDGWCDDPVHPLYNRHVTLPLDASHEMLWREDAVYDVIVPLGYNDDPIEPGRGSAIFLHVMRPDGVGTEGCIALKLLDLLELLAQVGPQTQLTVVA